MTPLEQASAILKAAEEATRAPWNHGRDPSHFDAPEVTKADGAFYVGVKLEDAAFIALARNTAPAIALALIEKHRALEEARELITELLTATGYDKADRKALQNEYMAGGKGAGTILSCLNFLARQGATA